MCGSHLSNNIKTNIDEIGNNCLNNDIPITKKVIYLQILIEFIHSSPTVSFNKMMKTESFLMKIILIYYKDEYLEMRKIISDLTYSFFSLIENRENLLELIEKLKSVILSDYIDTIGKKAFSDCVRLEEITIGRGLKTLKSSAFSGDKRLKKIRFKSLKLKTVGKKVFKGIHKKAVIRVPKKKLKKYTKLFTKKGQGKDVVIK